MGYWMTKKLKLVVDINGRKALPVRALCLVAGYKRLSPDVVAGAACGEGHYDGDRHLPTYQLVDGVAHSIDPAHWAIFERAIQSSSLLLAEQGPSRKATWEQWGYDATKKLPSDAFVWLDEFQSWFRRTRPYRVEVDANGLYLEPPEEGGISLFPLIPGVLRDCLLEGVSSVSELLAAPAPEQPAEIEPQAPHQAEQPAGIELEPVQCQPDSPAAAAPQTAPGAAQVKRTRTDNLKRAIFDAWSEGLLPDAPASELFDYLARKDGSGFIRGRDGNELAWENSSGGLSRTSIKALSTRLPEYRKQYKSSP